jgi:glycosyltransferase involved in cell wall biosynthesis
LKIGLNATCFNDRPSGARQRFVGIYGELIKRLPDAEFVMYEPADCRVASWFDGAPNVSVRRTPLPSEGRGRRALYGLGFWHLALRGESFDLFERFNLPVVTPPSGRSLHTIHDIRGLRPEHGIFTRAAFSQIIERSLKAADHVITVSETMKNEILGFYPGLPISVIYNGLDASKFESVSESELAVVRRKFSLPQEFILAVGHFEKRKNYLRLIDAIARLRERGSPCALVIIGNDSGERKAIEERVAAANITGAVKILSDLSDQEVRCAYQLCSLFVFPSSYEGFGIPLLEAMAAKRPMVISDLPVFREITQDQGVYFAHDDIESMAFALEQVLASSSESGRLVEYGIKRVQEFRFENLAAQVESLYRTGL